MAEILLIAEDKDLWGGIQDALGNVHTLSRWPIPGGEDLETLLKIKHFDLILLSVPKVRDRDGFALMAQVTSLTPPTPIVAVGKDESPQLIVRAIKEGAFDFLAPPLSAERVALVLAKALEHRKLRDEIDYLRHEQDIIYDFERIIAQSPVMKRLIRTLKKFAATDSTLLMTGETGTGKSFLSGAVHFNSPRRKRPFIKINCANIPENLLESELFGHEKGAFTGANKTRVGRLEQGNGGTVFLDEIGEMSPALQAKLLRVLEEKAFERVGGNKTIHSDVRIIAATNKNPEQQVAEGLLREDLYYRINVLRVHLPPLRERRECIPLLAQHLLQKICRNLRKPLKGFSKEAMNALLSYHWPGNIRQLANVIERAAILEETALIQSESLLLPEMPGKEDHHGEETSSVGDRVRHAEREMILEALEKTHWIQKDAARILGISPRSLNYRIKRLGITHPRWRKHR